MLYHSMGMNHSITESIYCGMNYELVLSAATYTSSNVGCVRTESSPSSKSPPVCSSFGFLRAISLCYRLSPRLRVQRQARSNIHADSGGFFLPLFYRTRFPVLRQSYVTVSWLTMFCVTWRCSEPMVYIAVSTWQHDIVPISERARRPTLSFGCMQCECVHGRHSVNQ